MKTLWFFTSPTCSKCKIVYTWWNSFVEENTWLNYTIEDTSLSLEKAKNLNIRSLPSFVLEGENGELISIKSGTPSRGEIERWLTIYR